MPKFISDQDMIRMEAEAKKGPPIGLPSPTPTGSPAPSPAPQKSFISDEEMQNLESKGPSFSQKALRVGANTLIGAGKALDVASMGPAFRSGLMAAAEGKPVGKAFKENILINPLGDKLDQVPSGKQIAQKFGVSDNPVLDPSMVPDPEIDPLGYRDSRALSQVSRSGAAGLGIDMVANAPSVLGIAAKGLKAGGNALKSAAQGGASIWDDFLKRVNKAQSGPAPKVTDVPGESIASIKGVAPKADPIAGVASSDDIQAVLSAGRMEKPTAAQIKEASQRLGFKPTRGMLSADDIPGRLESSLEQSPSIAGALVRRNVKPVREGLKNAAGDVVGEVGVMDPYRTGESVKKSILGTAEANLKPLREKYDEIASYTKDIAITDKPKASVARNILNIPEAKVMPGGPADAIAQRYAKAAANISDANSLKSLISLAGQEKRGAKGVESYVLGQIEGKLKKLQERQIIRASVDSARTPKEGAMLGRETIAQLKDTNKKYREIAEGMRAFAKDVNLGKVKNIDDFTTKIEGLPSERLSSKLFNTNDVRLLNAVRKQYPNEFKLLRQQELSHIYQASLYKGEISPAKLVANVKKIPPEAQKILFGDKTATLDDIATVYNSLPAKDGPSGTPAGLMTQAIGQPGFEAKEMLRYGRYKALDVLQAPSAIVRRLGNVTGTKPVDAGINAAKTPEGQSALEKLLQGDHALPQNEAIKRRMMQKGKK